MSAPFRAQIQQSHAQALEKLGDQKTFPVPERLAGQMIIPYHAELRTLLSQLDTELSDTNEILQELTDPYDKWMQLRTNMTGNERTTDTPIYDQFVIDVPFMATVSGLRKYLRSLRAQKTALDRGLMTSTPMPNNISTSLIHLPKTTLPIFSGDCTSYKSFWNSFSSAVHNQSLPDSLKFVYLKQCLSGPPLNLVNALPVSDESYTSAIDLLSSHYDDPEEVARALQGSLKKLPRVRTGDTFCQDLRALIEQLEAICVHMSQQNQPHNTITIQMEVEQRLPRYVLDEIYLARESSEQWSTDQLREKLRSILKRKEQIDALLPKSDQPNRSKPFSRPTFGPPFNPQPTLTFHAQARPSQNRSYPTSNKIRPKLPCLFCNCPDHFSTKCDQFQTPDSRVQRLRVLNRCYKCLKEGHLARNCPSPTVCSGCRGGHPRPLCPTPSPNPPRMTTNFSHSNPNSLPVSSYHSPSVASHPTRYYGNQYSAPRYSPHPPPLAQPPPLLNNPSPQDHPSLQNDEMDIAYTNASTNSSLLKTPILLKCTTVTLFHPNDPARQCTAILLLDDASTNSYIDIQCARKLALPLTPVTTRLGVFNSPQPKTLQTHSTRFGLKLINGRSLIVTAHAVNNLTQPIPHIPFSKELLSYPGFNVPPNLVQPAVLLGADFYYELEPTPIQRLPSGYHLIHTLLGTLIAGRPINFRSSQSSRVINFCFQESHPTSPPPDFFTLEGIGVKDSPQIDSDDTSVLQRFNAEIECADGRYQVKLPFKANTNILPLPSNFGLCWGRLRSVLSSLNKSPSLLQKYHSTITDQCANGIIELVPKPNLISPPLHYLAHHPVINTTKNKLRIVYDGSAKLGREHSLNECLYQGPVIFPEMVGLLFRFRIPKYAIVCDIEKAFLQVSLHPSHRDCTRFLWLNNPQLPLSQQNLQIYRFTRVAFGLTCSPFLLAATIQYHLSKHPSPLSNELAQNTYVDNIFISATNPEEGKEKCAKTIALLKKAKMPLQEFASNSPEMIEHLPPELKLPGPDQKFLGLNWDTQKDNIRITVSPPSPSPTLTKRTTLSFVASHYDPFGLIVPVLLPLKIFVQSLWHANLGWDDQLPSESHKKWAQLTEKWYSHDCIEIPRSPIDRRSPLTSFELHCFADASGVAMCAAVYLRVSSPNSSSISSFLLFAKSKVKPTHKGSNLTIPRLELISVEMGIKALSFTQTHLKLNSLSPTLNLWTDSAIVLSWLNNQSPNKEIFVQNRLKTIYTLPHLIVRHVPGVSNPADIGTRGVPSISSLNALSQWWRGPSWLSLPSSEWPSNPEIKSFSTDKMDTQNKNSPIIITLHTDQNPSVVPIFNLLKYSRLPPLLRTVSYVNRFIALTDPRAQTRPNFQSLVISPQEIQKATNELLKHEQKLSPPPDKENEALALFLDPQKILRSRGRLGHSDLPISATEPIYLPRKSHLTYLIVHEIHITHQHSSPLSTLSIIRRNFWIPKGRRTVETILAKSCLPCRRFKTTPFDLPPFPHFPEARVRPSPPFSATGLDFCGPLYITNPSDVLTKKGSPPLKSWIAFWVCLTTRAISLELVPDQSVTTFLLSFRKFVAKFGVPIAIHCDNAPTFHAFSKFSQSHFPIQWHFRAPSAAWKGGHYERLVALIKHHLRRVLSGPRPRTLPWQQLTTIIFEIETVINSRPITFDSSNPLDPRPLRPIDFLHPLGHHPPILHMIPETPNTIKSTPQVLNDLWQNLSTATKSFWEKWSADYLLSLRERHQKLTSKCQRWPTVGELVLVYNQILPRSTWPLAVILKVYANETNFPSTAKIKTLSGRTTTRSVHHLFPLETADEINTHSQSNNDRPSHSTLIPIHPPAETTQSARRASHSELIPIPSPTPTPPPQHPPIHSQIHTERRWAAIPPNKQWALCPPTNRYQ